MTNPERQGCLTAILALFGFRLRSGAEPAQQLPYRLRDDFLSTAELSFYRVLQLAVRDRATILTKVNLADVFFVVRPKEHQSYRNKIDRKHVDFLLCDPATMKPHCGIELDDASHARRDRQDRDAFVDQVFQVAGLPLLRFPVRAGYDPKAIAHELTEFLGTPQVELPPAISPDSSSLPVCPKCDVPMVARVASKGPNKGKQFWGCQNYPRCKEAAWAN